MSNSRSLKKGEKRGGDRAWDPPEWAGTPVAEKNDALSMSVRDPEDAIERRARAIDSYRSSLWAGPSRLTTLSSLRKVAWVTWRELVIEPVVATAEEREEARWRLLAVYPWERIRPIDVVKIRSNLQELRNRKDEPITPNSIDKHLFSLRGLLRHCMLAGLISKDELEVVRSNAKRASGSRIARGRSLSVAEVRRLLDACDLDTNRGARDHAIISVLHAAGLRRDEVGTIQLASYDREGRTIRVVGKGNKEREVSIQPETVDAIDRWVAIRGRSPGPLFPRLAPGRGNRVMLGRRLSSQAVFRVLLDLVRKSGIESCAPHDLRRTFATDSWEAGIDLHMLREAMGHARVDTTLGYLRRNKRAKATAAEALAAYRKKQEKGS
jgi:integrase/recombinase XerD